MSTPVDQIKERVLSLFESGGRYQAEKVAVIVAYVVISAATLFWVAGAKDAENELGASHGYDTLAPLNQSIFFLENESGDDWTNVRVVLNKNYLFKAERLASGDRLMLRPESFKYYYYVPRPWGRSDWESLAEVPKPQALANDDVTWELVQVRAAEGKLDIDVRGAGGAAR